MNLGYAQLLLPGPKFHTADQSAPESTNCNCQRQRKGCSRRAPPARDTVARNIKLTESVDTRSDSARRRFQDQTIAVDY